MRRAPSGPAAALLLLATLLLAASLAPVALGQDAPPPAGPAPAAGEKAPAPAASAPAEPEDLEPLLWKNPKTLVALILLKIVPAIGGVVLLFVYAARRADVRKGALPAPPVRPPPVTPFDLPVALLLLVATLVVPEVLRLAVQAVRGEASAEWGLGARLATTAAGMVPVALLILWKRRAVRSAAGLAPLPPRTAVREGVSTFLLFSALGLALTLATRPVIEHVFNIPARPQDLIDLVVRPRQRLDPWLITAYGVLVAPVVEECVFRGMLQTSIGKAAGRTTGVVVASLLFAAIHVQKVEDVHSFVPLLGLALLLAWLYERTGSVRAVALAHALNNATTLVPFLLLSPS